jgi:Na+:H+ antiporter, NhaA family
MATDIAFALGALVLLGARISRSVLTFLLVLAIVDDLGALVVIALFCTKTLDGPLLLMALMWIGVLVLFNRVGVRRPWPYFVLGLLLWATLLKSGVHATLAGVATAFAIPARPKYDPTRFAELFDTLLQRYRSRIVPGESILRNQGLRSVLRVLPAAVRGSRLSAHYDVR